MTGFSDDLEGEPNFYYLYVNDTLYDPVVFSSWFVWNDTGPQITITPNNNNQGGNHSIGIMFDDEISVPVFMNFTIEVI